MLSPRPRKSLWDHERKCQKNIIYLRGELKDERFLKTKLRKSVWTRQNEQKQNQIMLGGGEVIITRRPFFLNFFASMNICSLFWSAKGILGGK